jgi:hypothetical protein
VKRIRTTPGVFDGTGAPGKELDPRHLYGTFGSPHGKRLSSFHERVRKPDESGRPAAEGVVIEGIRYIQLAKLIELKLASGITPTCRN